MGKNSKAENAAQVRERMEQLRREEAEKQKRQNRIFFIVILSVVAVILVGVAIAVILSLSQKPESNGGAPAPELVDQDASLFHEASEKTDFVKLTVSYTPLGGTEQQGDIIVQLFPDVAPASVANFQSLVASHFYDGTPFHRIVPDFMIQGGGSDDSLTPIRGEFTSNGFVNNLKHVRGVLSMARTSVNNDSATSQFFIVHQTSPHLDGNYASFGYVVSGMDVVDAIAAVELESIPGSIDSVPSSPVDPVTLLKAVFVEK